MSATEAEIWPTSMTLRTLNEVQDAAGHTPEPAH